MNVFPAFIRLKTSGYELVAYSLEDIPRGVEFVMLARNIRYKR